MQWPGISIDLATGAYCGTVEGALTPTEARVVRYLAGRLGKGETVEDLEHDVWELAPAARSKMVAVTLRRLRSTLGIVQRRPEGTWALVRSSAPDVQVSHPL